jgi:hypothetical protein
VATKTFILSFILLLLLLKTAAAAGPEFEFIRYPDKVNTAEKFEFTVKIKNLVPSMGYSLKAIGGEGLKEVQTLNEETQKWLNYTSAWTEFQLFSPDEGGILQVVLAARFKTETAEGENVLGLRLRDRNTDKNYDSQTVFINVIKLTPTPTPEPTRKPTATAKPTPTFKPIANADNNIRTPTPTLQYRNDIFGVIDDNGETIINAEDDKLDLNNPQHFTDARAEFAEDNGKGNNDNENGKLAERKKIFPGIFLGTGGLCFLSGGIYLIIRNKKVHNLENDKQTD